MQKTFQLTREEALTFENIALKRSMLQAQLEDLNRQGIALAAEVKARTGYDPMDGRVDLAARTVTIETEVPDGNDQHT